LTTFTPAELTLNQIKELFSPQFIKQLDKMFMCGVLGEPAAGKETLDIFRYFRELNPNITLGMNTNGGLRNVWWWESIAKLLSKQGDYVVFSIDGLEDTNHVYRINVNWKMLMRNAKAFVNAGGSAHWDMLVFEHNEHQVDMAQKFAKELGFSWFRAKVSRRHKESPVEFLSLPKAWKNPNVEQGRIDCNALKEKSLYVSAQGVIYPCCWMTGEEPQENIVQWFTTLSTSWDKTPHPICKSTCSQNNKVTSFTGQWQREVELNV
jgi:MoaA/NifB/PqqE/SkfB family radical SAM enzyme